MTRPAPGNQPGVQGEARLPAVLDSVPRARALVRAAAAERGIDRETAWALMLAVTEAVGNAVEHGEGETVWLLIDFDGNELSVGVLSQGPFRVDLANDDGPKRGRGLPLMAEVVDRLHLEPGDDQSLVRFAKDTRAA